MDEEVFKKILHQYLSVLDMHPKPAVIKKHQHPFNYKCDYKGEYRWIINPEYLTYDCTKTLWPDIVADIEKQIITRSVLKHQLPNDIIDLICGYPLCHKVKDTEVRLINLPSTIPPW